MGFPNNQYGSQQPQQPTAQPAGGDVRSLLKAGAAIAAPHKNPDPDGVAYAVVPEGFEVKALPTRQYPSRPIATVKLRDAASFIGYVRAYSSKHARIYATLDPARFVAVLDDFLPGDNDPSRIANWREWRVQFAVPVSREWGIWKENDKKHMDQKAFGEFLQDNLPDVVRPDGATLLELAMDFEASTAGNFRSVQRLRDGSHTLVWANEKNATGSIKLPPQFELSIPVFENSACRSLTARMRFETENGKLQLWYELERPHKVLESAFMDAWGQIREGTGVPMLLGSPE